VFKQLDDAYQHHYLKAVTKQDFQALRDHLAYMTGYHIPSFHVDEAAGRQKFEYRWAMIQALCDLRVRSFEIAAEMYANPESEGALYAGPTVSY
jgi:hypothetical protein